MLVLLPSPLASLPLPFLAFSFHVLDTNSWLVSFGTLTWYLPEVNYIVLLILIYRWITPIFSLWGGSHVLGLQMKGLTLLVFRYQISARLETQPLLSNQEVENNIYISGVIGLQISLLLTPCFILKRKREKKNLNCQCLLYSSSLESRTYCS